MLTMAWASVFWTRLTQRWYTGSQYGRKPLCRAVATDDRHWARRAAEEAHSQRPVRINVIAATASRWLPAVWHVHWTVSICDSPLIKGRGLCPHLSAGSTSGWAVASTSGCIPVKADGNVRADRPLCKSPVQMIEKGEFILLWDVSWFLRTGLLRWCPTESARVPMAS